MGKNMGKKMTGPLPDLLTVQGLVIYLLVWSRGLRVRGPSGHCAPLGYFFLPIHRIWGTEIVYPLC